MEIKEHKIWFWHLILINAHENMIVGEKLECIFFYISILPEIDDGIKEIGICDIFHFQ